MSASLWAAKKIGDTSNGDGVFAITRNGLTVAEPLLRASALEIVRACNSHDALVAALVRAYNDLDHIAADTASDVDGMTRAGISDFADKCAKRINAVLKDARPDSLTEQVIHDNNVDPVFRAALKAAKEST